MISRYFVYFIIYSFIGWIYETCYCTIHDKTWQNRGFLYGPCIPLYGVGATLTQILFIEIPYAPLHNASYPIIFIVCAIGSFILEYGTSYVLEKRFNARWWDYSEFPLNINGRVCIMFTFCFGLAGILVSRFVAPPIMTAVMMIPQLVIELLSLIFMFLFGMDMALTVSAITSFAKDFERINERINAQMAERVENLEGFKDQISTEAIKEWFKNASWPERWQFKHIRKFTHPVASTKALLNKGSQYLRDRKNKSA